MKKLVILGTRGIPAEHGGFETFAEKLSIYLVSKGWQVRVYCQNEGNGDIFEDEWMGVGRVHIPVSQTGSMGSVIFDWHASWRAMTETGLILTLGYNTAIFNVLQRLRSQKMLINMDGIEWRRGKWGRLAKLWFWTNEWIGCFLASHLVADHPVIKEHLSRRVSPHKITFIPYGGEEIESSDPSELLSFNVEVGQYAIIVARPEPENSILEVVRAFSSKVRNHKLVVLGLFEPEINAYHKEVLRSASNEVLFPGPIYDPNRLAALRFFASCYLHGHTVGGTNPSLVEAMGAGCAILAHDNPFNRWVAGEGNWYFSDERSCAEMLEMLLSSEETRNSLRNFSKARFASEFHWPPILEQYENLLEDWVAD